MIDGFFDTLKPSPGEGLEKGTPIGVPHFYLAASTIAAVAAGAYAAAIVVAAAAAAEQNDQNDNPPNTAATEAITVTHNHYLRNSYSEHWAHSMVFRRSKKVHRFTDTSVPVLQRNPHL